MGNRGPQPGGVAFEQLAGQITIKDVLYEIRDEAGGVVDMSGGRVSFETEADFIEYMNEGSDEPEYPETEAWMRTAQINSAADFINDATQDLPRDVFAAVLQAAIARRD